MSKEKRSNLAIFTLAGSILISSVIVSMNQVNAHSTSATKKEFLALKQCINNFSSFSEEFVEYLDSYEERKEFFEGIIDGVFYVKKYALPLRCDCKQENQKRRQ
jgi:hypothetical protein